MPSDNRQLRLSAPDFRCFNDDDPREVCVLAVPLSRSHAETLGLKALRFLASTPEAFERFLTLSGTDAGNLRQCATEPEWLAAVLEFLLANEALLVQFCEDERIDSRMLHLAAARLGM